MLQTGLIVASIAAGGIVVFALDRYIRSHKRTPVNYLVFFAMVGASYYFGLEGLLGAVVLAVAINGVHALAARKQSAAKTIP